MSRSVLYSRALLIQMSIWAAGACLVWVGYRLTGTSTTVTGLKDAGGGERLQLLWFALNAFVCCIAALLGVVLPGRSMVDEHLARPQHSALTIGLLASGAGLTVCALTAVLGYVPLALAWAAGVGIGGCAGAYYVVQVGGPSGAGDMWGEARQHSVGWGSR